MRWIYGVVVMVVLLAGCGSPQPPQPPKWRLESGVQYHQVRVHPRPEPDEWYWTEVREWKTVERGLVDRLTCEVVRKTQPSNANYLPGAFPPTVSNVTVYRCVEDGSAKKEETK